MRSEARMALAIWEAVRDNGLPADKRTEVAESILRAMEEYGFDAKDLDALSHEDDDLSTAYSVVFDVDHDEDEEDGADEDWEE